MHFYSYLSVPHFSLAHNNKDFQRVNNEWWRIHELHSYVPASSEAEEQKKILRWPPRPLSAPSMPSVRPLPQWPVSIMNVIRTLSLTHVWSISSSICFTIHYLSPGFSCGFGLCSHSSLELNRQPGVFAMEWKKKALWICVWPYYYMLSLRCIIIIKCTKLE